MVGGPLLQDVGIGAEELAAGVDVVEGEVGADVKVVEDEGWRCNRVWIPRVRRGA